MIDQNGETRCDRCQKVLTHGEHPFCPHGFGGNFRTRDEIPGGMVLENYGPHPITVYSHSERRRIMTTPRTDHLGREYILTEKESWAPMPGTDKDPQGIPNPAGYLDPQTLANAAILLARNGRMVREEGSRDGEPVEWFRPQPMEALTIPEIAERFEGKS